MDQELEGLWVRVGAALLERKSMLACAESCTGGWVSEVVTATAGSSQWFERGFVTYSNAAKQELLGVKADTLRQDGAVSEAVVREMAAGALRRSHAQAALAISGVADRSLSCRVGAFSRSRSRAFAYDDIDCRLSSA